MTEEQVADIASGLYEKIKALTAEINILHLAAIEADKRAGILHELARVIAQDATAQSEMVESLALLSCIAAKSSHIAARSRNEIDWILLAEKADLAAKDVYDCAVRVLQSNKERQINGDAHPDIPISPKNSLP